MKLSVIIPAYNSEDTIGVQLEALSQQHWEAPWEVIVADNGSNDGTIAVIERFQNAIPNLRVIDASGTRGAGHARNRGAEEAVGDALLFCDADDEVAEGWLAAMGRALQQYDFVASAFEGDKLSDPAAIKNRSCPQERALQEYRYPPFLPHAGAGGLGIKRVVHQRVGGFDETFYKLQDTDYCWRVQLAGVELHFVPDAVVHVRFRGDQKLGYRQAREWGEYNVRLYKKFRPLGMPRLPLRLGVRRWLRLLRRAYHLVDAERRERWLRQFHWRVGRVVGCVKYRVLAF